MRCIKKLFIFLFILLSFNFVFFCNVNASDENIPNIASPSALLMDLNTGKILYEKNINKEMYPASLTKVMTAVLALENCELTDVATVSENAVMSISSGYVTANLKIGEEVTIEQLLSVLLVGSANDSAVVIAEHISGSVEEFSILMNNKAKELGCTSTNFSNPYGAHEESHYSTAYDLALIAKHAMQNETFRTLVSTTSYTLPTTNKYDKEDRYFSTTNALLYNNEYSYKYATGVKTGFTTPAKNCLIASAKKNDLELLTVVLGADQNEQGKSNRYLDTINLFEYGFDTYSLIEVIKSGETVHTATISKATRNTKKLDTVINKDIYALVKQENKNDVARPEVTLNENLKAPIKKGDIVGSVKYTIEGVEYTADLLASNDVKKSKAFITFIIILFILLLCWLNLKNKKRKRKNTRLKTRIIR